MKLFTHIAFKDFAWQMIRFGITGIAATFIHFSSVILLVETTHLPPLTANSFGFLNGLVVSFSGHRFWTFSKTSRTIRASFPRFFLIAALNFIGNQILYYLLLEKLHIHYTIALIIVLGIMAIVTYCLSKWWAFR